jgi:peroxiredoxin Q/BCP
MIQKTYWYLFIIAFQLLIGCASDALQTGETAPDFTLKNQAGNEVSLSDYKGGYVILFFYGRSDNKASVGHVKNFESDFNFYRQSRMTVIGINAEREEVIRNFYFRNNFSFDLLIDKKKAVMKSYGVTAGLSGSGRITFIIDPKQKIVSVIEEDEIDEHREVVRNEVEDIVKQ